MVINLLFFLHKKSDIFLNSTLFSWSKLNITEATSAAGEELARQEEYPESLSIIIFFYFYDKQN